LYENVKSHLESLKTGVSFK